MSDIFLRLGCLLLASESLQFNMVTTKKPDVDAGWSIHHWTVAAVRTVFLTPRVVYIFILNRRNYETV